EAIDPLTLEQLADGISAETYATVASAESAPEPLAEAEAEAEAEAWPVEPVLENELDEEMVEIFLDEAVDLLESAGGALERWLGDPSNQLALSALLRDLHTLKGGARMAEIRPIGDLAHELETLYEGLSDGRYVHTNDLATLLLRSHDQLAVQLEQLQAHHPMDAAMRLIEQIRAYRQGVAPSFDPAVSSDDEMPMAEEAPQGELIADAPEQLDDTLSGLDTDSDGLGATLPADDALVFEALDQPLAQVAAELSEEPEEPESAESQELTPAAKSGKTGEGRWESRDPELVEIFLDEGFDIIERAGASLQRWMEDVDNSFEIEALQRDLHTLKGGARMADIREIGDLAHELEYLYEGLCAGHYRASETLFTLLQTCHDRLAAMLDAVRAFRELPDGQDLIATIQRFRANPEEQLSMPSSVALKAAEEAAQDAAEAEILDIFVEEADELLEEMETALGRWEATRDSAGPLADMMRVLHTLKGGARLAAQGRLGDMAHDLEQRLSEAQLQDNPWTDSLFMDVQGGYDALLKEVESMRSRLIAEPEFATDRKLQESQPDDYAESSVIMLETPIVAASAQATVNSSPAKVLPFIRRAEQAALDAASRRAPQELVKVPAELLEGLVNLAGETSIFRGRVEQQVSDVGFTLSEMEATIERVRDQLRRLDTETQAQILSRYQAEAERAGYDDFDPLEMDRHSQLQQLSRALFESASDLLDLKETLAARNRDAETLLLQQARVNTELQEGLMRTRMVPFDRLVPRLRRIVRQVAGELGKQVEFHVGNATGEMDRSVLERIVAPLEHMLRNAVDHGIEVGTKRVAAGKPEHGNIRLDLSREGGDIVLALSDDGAGINLEAVRRKAIERGLMQPGSELSDHDVLQFILEAGFSTAEQVTQISGRGVGMDVVHSEVKQLGGSMSIESTLGKGTRFLIRLPFTVSVNRALMVYSGEDLYAIPLNTIEGIVRVSPYELEAYYQPGASRFEYAGQTYELRYLGELLNNGHRPKLVGQSLPLPVILVRSNEHSVAVQVDSLAGSREIVVKGLGPQFATVPGISGATILGDGRVVVILDLLATIRVLHAHLLTQQQPLRLLGDEEQAEVEVDRPTLVMVVDDSVTVRKVTSRLLERNGMNVLTAKDGVDAITQLQERKPDIILLDIEMPRMDGFEVATLVRHDEHLKDLPIIMITSRTGDKHRDRAMAIGVNEYLGKPYQESLLLEAIQQLVTRHE
ncbi:chemosensory pili system protein ChpA (sensor histidine kinase/response regulator), partial [Stutzerimonas xanthomarina]